MGEMGRIVMLGRGSITIAGVVDVLGFDDQEVKMLTGEGLLIIRGRELKVKGLSVSQGEAAVEGKIDGLLYDEKRGKKKKNTGRKEENQGIKRFFG